MICARGDQAIAVTGGLEEHQYGFQKKRSILDTVSLVTDIARIAIEGKRWEGETKKYYVIIALDVENAFNLAQWRKKHGA